MKFLALAILPFQMIILSSCGNILIRSNPKEEIHLAKFEKPKTLTLRHGTLVAENRYRKDYGIGYQPLFEYEVTAIEKALKETEFTLSKTKTLERKEFKKEDYEIASNFLEKDAFDEDSDFQLNIYTEIRYGHSLMIYPYLIWTAGHIVTLGLLPLRVPIEFSYFGDIRAKDGKTIYNFKKICQGERWAWSPLLLAGHWQKPVVANEAFNKDCILSILADAQKERAFLVEK